MVQALIPWFTQVMQSTCLGHLHSLKTVVHSQQTGLHKPPNSCCPVSDLKQSTWKVIQCS